MKTVMHDVLFTMTRHCNSVMFLDYVKSLGNILTRIPGSSSMILEVEVMTPPLHRFCLCIGVVDFTKQTLLTNIYHLQYFLLCISNRDNNTIKDHVRSSVMNWIQFKTVQTCQNQQDHLAMEMDLIIKR